MKNYVIDQQFNIRQKNKETVEKKQQDNLLIAKYLGIGYYLVTPILLGVFLGLFLDRKLNSHGVITIIMIVLGSVMAMYNLFKLK